MTEYRPALRVLQDYQLEQGNTVLSYPVTLNDFGITQYELLPSQQRARFWWCPLYTSPLAQEQSQPPVPEALLETIDSALVERVRLKKFDISIKKKYHRSS